MKKLFKIFLWLAGILALLLVLTIVGLRLFFPTEKIRAMVVEEGSSKLGRPVEIDALDLSIWGGLGVELEGVKVGNPEGLNAPDLLTASRVDLKLQMWPLLFGDYRVYRLIIDAPIVNMRKTADGESNYVLIAGDSTTVSGNLDAVPEEAQTAALALSFDELEISDGRFSFVDDSSGTSFRLMGVSLSSSLEYPEEGIYRSTGTLAADTVLVDFEESYPPYAAELDYRLMYDVGRDNLDVERLSATLNQARVKLTGQLGGFASELSASLNAKSERLPITELLSLLPPGQRELLADYTVGGSFSLDADISRNPELSRPDWHYTGSATLNDLDVTSRLFEGRLTVARCLVDFKPDNVRVNIEQGAFDGQPIKGHLVLDNFDNPNVSGELAGKLDLALITPFLPAEAGHRVAGRADFDLKFSGPILVPEQLSFTGDLTVSEGNYNSDYVPEPIESFDLDAYFENRLVKIRRLACRFPSGQLDFTGRMTDLVPYLLGDSTVGAAPDLEAQVSGQVDLAMAGPYLPPKGDPRVAGRLDLDVGFAGNITNLSSFRALGLVSVSDGAYSDSLLPEPVEHFEARMTLRPDTIEVTRLTARLTSSDVAFTGQLIRPFPYFLPILGLQRDTMPKPLFLFELYSRRFDADRLFPEAVPGAAGDDVAFSSDSISSVMLPDIEGRGRVRADTVIYSKVELTEVEARVRFADRKIEAYDATARVYSGAVSGKTTIDLSNFNDPQYTGEFNATQIEADDFASRFSKFGGHLFGKGNFEGSYRACGWEPEQFFESLSVDGDLEVRDGRLLTSGAALSAITQLASAVGETFEPEQTIRNFASKVFVKDGRVGTEELISRLGDIGDIKLTGTYGFDETLQYAGTLVLSAARSEKLGLSGSERAKLPFQIGGTLTSPKLDFDLAALLSQAGKSKLKEAAGKALRDLFKRD